MVTVCQLSIWCNMPINVPYPITSPSPVSVTHTPYDPSGVLNSGMSAPSFAAFANAQLPPIGTITNMFPQQKKAVAPSQIYKPADPGHVAQYLQKLNLGWSVDPNTGQMISPGMRGGTSLANYAAHKGILDPTSALAAINQFKGAGGVAQYGVGGYKAPGAGVPAGFWGGSNVPGYTPYLPPPQGPGQAQQIASQQAAVPANMTFSSTGYRRF